MSFLDRNVLVDGVRLAYRDRGEGDPVVFVHGTPSWSHEWRHVVPHVEAAGHRVITYDLLGYGDSERPLDRDTSVGAQTDLLLALLDELGVENPSLITHDIGGAIGQRVAVLHPGTVRRLMLVDTVSYDSWPSETWREIIRTRLDGDANMSADEFEAMLTRQLTMTVADEAVMAGDDLRAFLAPHRTALGRTSFFEHQVRHYDSTYTEELTDRLGTIDVPVRIVWGREDRWQPVSYAEKLAADIPGASLVVLDDAGHFLMEDDPVRLTREVLDFLAGP
ncbi:pimeloyl-ACP methyl ester carboxylesterase [Actinomycetospora succinea]|uniref:Pimeloyl-ACP methyl ester carboxylesterase n=1 Tax=Actinomycetospora succinea TaxID=663603 RepID=A0A4R6UM24_9PSEU|nr:alpha/beta hydrolase [Actinomycetospora succinea]TDQ46453.1 pimeloyl-ACP methyl ester carboxylesterase [Actinomycetospora succinea]